MYSVNVSGLKAWTYRHVHKAYGLHCMLRLTTDKLFCVRHDKLETTFSAESQRKKTLTAELTVCEWARHSEQMSARLQAMSPGPPVELVKNID